MNITVLELNEDNVKISLSGQGHTFMNALISEIQKDPTVDVATYIIEFQFSDPVMTVTTHDNKDPIAPILAACTRLSSTCSTLMQDLINIQQ